MNRDILLVRKNKKGTPQFLKITLTGDTVSREWGLIRGKSRKTAHTYGTINAGKSNELGPEQAAQADFDRIVGKKCKAGYVQATHLDNLPDLDQPVRIDLDNIPAALCVSKPRQSASPATLDRLARSENGKFFIKYNGLFHFVLIKTDGEIRIFTRRWCDHTAKYPEIVQAVKDCNYPNGTLLGFEFCIDPTLKIPHMTAFKLMSGISKADCADGRIKNPDLPNTRARLQQHRVRAAAITLLYCDGAPTWHAAYGDILHRLTLKMPRIADQKAIFVPTEVPVQSGAQALELVKANKDSIEGFIAWDLTQSMTVTLNGRPDRSAAWKVKAQGEKDVIATGYEPGSGRHQGRIGSLRIGQYDARGTWTDLGTVGGLPDDMRDPDTWEFPCVIEVIFDQIFPDTGKFQFGRFSKIHEDKTPEDVQVFAI